VQHEHVAVQRSWTSPSSASLAGAASLLSVR
jgi:hypothetical protein